MTEEDVVRMELALGVKLPKAYREVMVPFPIPAWSGNSETALWDDADRLTALNQELRNGSKFVDPWPAHMFALGRDDSGSANAVDLSDPMNRVWWADRCELNLTPGDSAPPPFREWASKCVAELDTSLVEQGVDRKSSRASRRQAEEESARAEGRCVIYLIGIGLAALLALWGITTWMNSR